MTEIVAAHLERVASELARDLEKRGFLSSETFRAEVEPVLAAALAACAREEAKDEFTWAIDALKDMGHLDIAFALLARHRVRERAAGEKA